ncbi:hypothetical protein OSB04_006806 [Centaurea solstitialis]|uniref:Uncharacterized protein n=1 Tax=Centaurea solstitialis TaxID=347529 RepID=A0AA38TWH0_9ASTR|nr:hypothetical protein OSB04_006806 [Centaurea solstitialis]
MNGVSERRNRTLLDMVRSMMCRSTLPVSFWGHALETAANILNKVPTKSVERTPYEIWTGKKPKLSFLKIWGCEEKFLDQENTRNDVDLQIVEEDTPIPIVEPFTQQDNVETQPKTAEEVQTQDLRRSTRIRQEPDRYLGFLVSQDGGDLNEPTSYGEAVQASMYDNQVWELTDLPQHCRAVARKWVFKKKTDMDGNVHTFKARLVTKGFTQTHGIDYDETFSPVAMLKSIRILMAISVYFNYEIWQMDVKAAFLNGKLTEDASRSWNLHFDERIKEFGFTKSEFEPCVYTKFSGSIVTFLVLYVDDILLIGNDVPTLQSVKAWLSRCFQMKDLGEAAYILGIKIYKNRSRRLIRLSQSTYIDKVLKRFRMDESKKGFIPMQHGIVLSKAQCPESSQDKDIMKSIPYASAIGSIMYAMLCTRPDVAYLVSVTSRYQQNPGEAHWVAVKKILKYLRRTKEMFLVFGDASFQTNRDDFRSQSGYVFTLNGGAISWKSSKQDTIADSTTEAKYITASDAAKEAVWLRNFIKDLRVVASISRPVDIYCDNSGAVAQAKEPREHHKSRHVLRKFHLIREIIGRGDVRIRKIPTDENVADPLTKLLARVKHESHANSIGMQYLDTSWISWFGNCFIRYVIVLSHKFPTRMGYKMVQEELVYLMWFSLPKEIRVTASEYMGGPKMDVAKVHEDILASLEPKPVAAAELMESDWIDELGDLSCPECGSKYICVHSMDIDQLDIGSPMDQGFKRRETLKKDRSNLRVGVGTMLVAEAVGSYTTPTNGLYVLNLQESNKEIYHISKRSKEIEDQTYLWHCRLGHINKKRIEQLQKGGIMGSFDFRPFNNCESCLSGKTTKQPFNKDKERASELLGIIHTDVCGPFNHEARGGYRYFITFTDDFSSQEFDNHLMECGIVSQLIPPYTLQMNSVSEKRNCTLLDMFYNPSENKVFVARNGEFLEDKFLSLENTRNDVDLQEVEEDATLPIVEPVTQQEHVETQPEMVEEVQTQDLRRSTRVRQEPDRYLGFLVSQDGGEMNEPTTYGDTVSGNEPEQWLEAMKAEMQSMYDNLVWELTDLPQHCKVVGNKWVFKKKHIHG